MTNAAGKNVKPSWFGCKQVKGHPHLGSSWVPEEVYILLYAKTYESKTNSHWLLEASTPALCQMAPQ